MEKRNYRNKKPPVRTGSSPRGGLRQKPMRKRSGGPIGSRVLTTSRMLKDTKSIPPVGDKDIRVLVFGGVEEIGKNMYGIEYKDNIIILDCGVMFGDESTPGIDFVVPNVQYLEERKDKIKAMIITHGHLDHIGSIPLLIERLGYPKIYSRQLTLELIKERQKEFPNLQPLDLNVVKKSDVLDIDDDLKVNFFGVTHTIPDSMGIYVETPFGGVAFTGDIKLIHKDGEVSKTEEKEFEFFKKKKTLAVISDSTNAEKPGWSVPESNVINTIDKIIKEAKGRVILASFASQIERNVKIIDNAVASGRKVVIQGRSMITNLTIASELGLLKTKPSELIPVEKCGDYPEDRLAVLTTGGQGEEYSGLWRLSERQHKYIKVTPNDTIIFSSSVIPGNERSIQTLKDKLSRLGPSIITYQTSDVHSSGHGNREELKWVHNKIKSKYLIPVHGYHYMLAAHSSLFKEIGHNESDVVIPDNGSIIEIKDEGKKIEKSKFKMPTDITIVDGNALGTIQNVVIQDRKTLSEDGIFVTVILINQRQRKVKKSPDIISRGFVYLRESQDLINQARIVIKKTAENNMKSGETINIESMKKALTKELQSFLLNQTNKKPIIIPVIFLN